MTELEKEIYEKVTAVLREYESDIFTNEILKTKESLVKMYKLLVEIQSKLQSR
jgi:hypothetical protein